MINSAKLLRELIALPSVNPAFVPAESPYGGEGRVADFLAGMARSAGLDVEFQPVSANRANLLARYSPPSLVKQRILLAPHMDTVGGSPVTEELFRPQLRGNRLFGRGACDTKGSVAAMIWALIRVATTGEKPSQTEITFAGLVDEESAQTGSRALAASKFRADLAIVGEPTRLKVVTAHKGVLWLELVTKGKAAHGARPELGRNAVHEMARAVDLLETSYASQLRKQKHSLLGHATVNVGAIRGGSQPNIVPAECSSLVDRRLLPGESDLGVMRQMATLFRKNKVRVSMRRSHPAECAALETSPRNKLVQLFLRSAGQRQPAGVDYFSDAGVLAQGGISCVVFGPGDIAQAHTPDEWIDLRQLERAGQMLERFLRSLP